MVSIWLTAVKTRDDFAKVAENRPPVGDRFSENLRRPVGLLAILLNAGGPQPRQTVLVDRKLPGQEFVDGQRVAAAGFLKGKQATANGGNDLSLAADDPPFGSGRGQIRDGQRTAVGPMTYLTLGRWGSVMAYSQTLTTELTTAIYADRLKNCLSVIVQYD